MLVWHGSVEGCYRLVIGLEVMQPEDLRLHVQTLQSTIDSLLDAWTLVICSHHQRMQDTTALLLPQLQFSASSTVELLALPLPETGQLLVLCDDDGPDGGAAELMTLMREHHGAKRCRFLLCLDAAISGERLVRLWRLRPDGISCRESCGSGRLLQCVAVLLRHGRYEDPQLSDRIRQLLAHTPLQEEAVVLSVKEEQLVRLVAGGRSTREIGSQLQVRTDTVRRRLSALYGKTGARNQGALLVWGIEHGVLKQPDLACGLHQRPGQEQGAAAGGNRHRSRATRR
ncbi:response regulator transcription factor [Vulcanococcus sp.]|uniref:helix-turn-helix transcriptional regulator n=1 Tax=Vulcanococcus sp. TaxID=2856995 RepID=UPI003F6A10EC